MLLGPGPPIWLEVDEFSRDPWKIDPRGILRRISCTLQRFIWRGVAHEPGNFLWFSRLKQRGAEVGQGLLGFSIQDVVDTVIQIVVWVIGGVGSMGNHGDAFGVGHSGQLICQLSHVREAYLRNEVEVVFVYDDDLRFVFLQRTCKSRNRCSERCVEDGNGDACSTQCGGRIERAERRVRLHLPQLLRVIWKMVRVRQEDICHRAPPELNKSAHIGGLRGKFLAGYERAALDKAFGKLGEPKLPGNGEETGTQPPANTCLYDQTGNSLCEGRFFRHAPQLTDEQKIREHSIEARKLAPFEPRQEVGAEGHLHPSL